MKTFYSILKIAPNIATSDTIAVGVILYDGNRFHYYFSDYKKKIAVKMLKQEVNINYLLNQVATRCEEFNSEHSENKLLYNTIDFSNASYFEYLSRYSNGLLQFSKPNKLDEQNIDLLKFNKIVNYLFNENIIDTVETPFPNISKYIVEEKLVDKVKDKVHTHYKFSEESVQGLYFNFEMECIGRNGSLIGAKYVDFSKTIATIDNTISHYFTLISNLSLEYNMDLQDNNFFLLSEEPSIVGSKEHRLWESVNNNPLVSVISPEESEKVAELIFEKQASVFLD